MTMKQVELAGEVRRRLVNAGSKSEHSAVVLDTPDGATYELRAPGGNPFETGDLDRLVGQEIVTRGVLADQTLLMQDWRPAAGAAARAARKP